MAHAPAVRLALSLLASSFAIPVSAQITPVSPGAFSGSATLITFQGQSGGGRTTVTTVSGVTFSSGNPYLSLGQDPVGRPVGPQETTTVDNRSDRAPVTLAFASPFTRVGFEVRYNSCDTRATLLFFSGQTQIGSAETAPSQPYAQQCSPAYWLFAGFQSAVPFDRVVITAPQGYMRLDNIRFEGAPPPPPVITPLKDPSSFSAQATLITFQAQGQSGTPTVSSLGGATFSAGSTNYVSVGMDDRARPFGPPDPANVDNRPSASQPISMAFSPPITKIGFEASYNGCGETLLVEFFSGTAAVGSARTPPSPQMPGGNCSPGFFVFGAFQVSVPFDRIRVTGPMNGYVRLDNIRFDR